MALKYLFFRELHIHSHLNIPLSMQNKATKTPDLNHVFVACRTFGDPKSQSTRYVYYFIQQDDQGLNIKHDTFGKDFSGYMKYYLGDCVDSHQDIETRINNLANFFEILNDSDELKKNDDLFKLLTITVHNTKTLINLMLHSSNSVLKKEQKDELKKDLNDDTMGILSFLNKYKPYCIQQETLNKTRKEKQEKKKEEKRIAREEKIEHIESKINSIKTKSKNAYYECKKYISNTPMIIKYTIIDKQKAIVDKTKSVYENWKQQCISKKEAKQQIKFEKTYRQIYGGETEDNTPKSPRK